MAANYTIAELKAFKKGDEIDTDRLHDYYHSTPSGVTKNHKKFKPLLNPKGIVRKATSRSIHVSVENQQSHRNRQTTYVFVFGRLNIKFSERKNRTVDNSHLYK